MRFASWLLFGAMLAGGAGLPDNGWVGGTTSEDYVHVGVSKAQGAVSGEVRGATPSTSRVLPSEYGNFYTCANGTPMTPGSSCVGGDNLSPIGCPAGTTLVPPRWSRTAVSVDPLTWGPWRNVRGRVCEVEQQVALEDAIRLAWEQMPIAPHEIRLQPDQGWVFSSVPTIGMVDTEPRQIATVLLGRDVLIRALPTSMRWDWGHGNPTVTSDTGKPYPDHTISHTYAYFEGDVTVNLTTTWTGQYSLNQGVSWLIAPGLATTTSTPVPLTVYNPHAHVMACEGQGC